MIGQHLMADLYGVSAERLNDGDLLAHCLLRAAERVGLTPVAAPVMHLFPGGGATGFLLLAESHIALHTYPEREFIAIDIFSCGKGDPALALEVFRAALEPRSMSVSAAPRGTEVP